MTGQFHRQFLCIFYFFSVLRRNLWGERGYEALPEQPGFRANAYDRGVTLAGRGETNRIHFEECKWANASKVRDADPKKQKHDFYF